MLHLDYRDARPIYVQIADGFRSQICYGILQQGEKLPSVRELAATLAINPNTIQRAYRELESAGLIVTVSGKGCFVSGKPENTASLWQSLDHAVKHLVDLGISREELEKHLGGVFDAANA